MPANLGSWLGSTVSTAVKPLYDCFIEHATYLFTTGRNIRDLDTNTRNFFGPRDDVQQQLETGRSNGLVETNEARTWLQRANKAISDEERNRKRYEQRCKIFGCCAPNCLSNYKISKKAAEALVEVNWCRDNRPTTITTEAPPRPMVPIEVNSVRLKGSQVSILNEALMCIKDDDTMGLIGIWGPRQVGKTLLLKMINNSFGVSTVPCTSEQTGDIVNHSTSSEITEEATNTSRSDRLESPFHFVIYVTASTNCAVENVQSEILRRLNMQVPDSETTRATRISNFLKDKSFLVLLDDLDNDVDMAAVGLPHPFGVHAQLKRKVVITTRTQTLCHKMKVNRDINVPGLQMDEALELFKESAGGDNLYSNPNIRAHMEDLVKILRVMPTELINFGRDMSGKGDPRQWQNVIHVIKELIKIQERGATSLRQEIVKKLTEDVEKLREERRDVGNKIELAKGNGMVATATAQAWLARAHTIISSGTDNAQSEPIEVNLDVSIAAAKLCELQECLNDGPRDIAQPPPVMHIPVHVVDLQPSQRFFLEQARHHITDDSEGMIGIWGPVGVGKTLLLNMINNSFETGNSFTASSSNRGDPPFDFVIYLVASEGCSVGNIQSEIMQRLKMQYGGDSVTTRATRIYNFLHDKSFLVLFDDVQAYLDLAAVGLPPLGIQGTLKRKVVITTRSPSLCEQMCVSRAMNVPGLELNEALQLFQASIGKDNLYSKPHIGPHAKDLVEQLRALPSELVKIGRAMRGKGEPRQWQHIIGVAKELIYIKDQEASSMTEGIITKLKQCLQNLRGRRNDVIHEIELGKREGKVATNQINNWLALVDTNISVGMVICESEQNGLNWDLSVIAAGMLRRLQECLGGQPSVVTVEALPPSVQEMPCSSTEQQPSRVEIYEEAMEYIKDNPVGVIGIWGLGGVGKTHLLTKINNSFLGDSLFDYVIFVTASKEGSVEKIQGDIAKKFSLWEANDVKSQAEKADIILDFLKTRSFLILLDDVWNQIDLEEVGIPYPLGSVAQPRRKVVLTTRKKNVCGLMDVRKEISVACLPHDEAWQLFQDKVGQETLSSSPRIEALAMKLAEELKGLPLALVTVGRAMYGKSDPTQWDSAIDYMKNSCCGGDNQNLNIENTVFKQLKYSYDNLRNDTLRECLLTCSLWPEDKEMFPRDLIRCWIGLGLIDECDIHGSYRKGNSLIGELTAACLLDSCKIVFDSDDHAYSLPKMDNVYQLMPEASVKMHDVIRDMAIWISGGCSDNNDKWVVCAGVGANLSIRTIPWNRAECISLVSNSIEELPPLRMITCSRKLKKLCLQDNILDERIFETIRSFTELTYLDLSQNKFTLIPEELCALVNLEHLDLSHNKKIYAVPIRLRELTKLKFLYLRGTRIEEIPEEVIPCLTQLQVIDLIPINCTPTIIEELCTLTNLKAVDIFIGDDDGYESLQKGARIPIRDLIIYGLRETNKFCLAVDALTGDISGRTLNALHIVECNIKQITVGAKVKPFDALNVLVLQELNKLTDITKWKGTSPQDLFPRLTYLDLYDCSKLQHLSWVRYLPCLEYLSVHTCEAMEQICMGAANHGANRYKGQESSKTFPCLKCLNLISCRRLSSLCGPDVTFPCLEELEIEQCPQLKRLPFTMQSLPHKFTKLVIDGEDWNNLEWEDEGVKYFLQQVVCF